MKVGCYRGYLLYTPISVLCPESEDRQYLYIIVWLFEFHGSFIFS